MNPYAHMHTLFHADSFAFRYASMTLTRNPQINQYIYICAHIPSSTFCTSIHVFRTLRTICAAGQITINSAQ